MRSSPPFRPGDRVSVRGEDHLGVHVVISCEWWSRVNPGIEPYWLVYCELDREPVDLSQYPPGTCGIVTHSSWTGNADRLILEKAACLSSTD